MITLFSLIAITSIWILGLTIATQEGMVLYGVREWAERKELKVMEAVILCVWCMSSIHSVAGFIFGLVLGIVKLKTLLLYPLVVMGSSLVSGFTWSLYDYIELKKKSLTDIKETD